MERDGQVFAVLYCGLEPLFTVFGKLVVGQKRYGEGDVGLGWTEVAVLEGLVDNVECSAATRLFQVGGHSSDGVDLKVGMFAAAQLFGCFKGGQGVFSEIAKESEGMESSGGEEMWFVNGMLPSAELAEKSFVGWQAGVEMSAAFCKLPPLSFELEVVGDERPIEWRHPVGNEVVFLDPSLVVGIVRGKLNGCEVVDVVVRMPVTKR